MHQLSQSIKINENIPSNQNIRQGTSKILKSITSWKDKLLRLGCDRFSCTKTIWQSQFIRRKRMFAHFKSYSFKKLKIAGIENYGNTSQGYAHLCTINVPFHNTIFWSLTSSSMKGVSCLTYDAKFLCFSMKREKWKKKNLQAQLAMSPQFPHCNNTWWDNKEKRQEYTLLEIEELN